MCTTHLLNRKLDFINVQYKCILVLTMKLFSFKEANISQIYITVQKFRVGNIFHVFKFPKKKRVCSAELNLFNQK